MPCSMLYAVQYGQHKLGLLSWPTYPKFFFNKLWRWKNVLHISLWRGRARVLMVNSSCLLSWCEEGKRSREEQDNDRQGVSGVHLHPTDVKHPYIRDTGLFSLFLFIEFDIFLFQGHFLSWGAPRCGCSTILSSSVRANNCMNWNQ